MQIGPFALQIWGILVAAGILLGAYSSARFAQKQGFSRDQIYNCAFYLILTAFIGARLFHVIAYYPHYYWRNPLQILFIWQGGYSVIGGFIGAFLAFIIFLRVKKLKFWDLADSMIYGLPLGLGTGRIGCFLIHDHPGVPTSFFLGVKQPNGTVIHDHGLYLSINGLLLALVFFWFNRKPQIKGYFLGFFLVWYGIVRFLLDFLRVGDMKYWHLTPAQYFSILMVLAGVICYINIYKYRKYEKKYI